MLPLSSAGQFSRHHMVKVHRRNKIHSYLKYCDTHASVYLTHIQCRCVANSTEVTDLLPAKSRTDAGTEADSFNMHLLQ